MARIRPKYPRQRQRLRKRFLSQALLLLCVAGAVAFYFCIKYSDPEAESLFLRFGKSLGEAKQAASRLAPSQTDPPGPLSVQKEALPSAKTPAAAPPLSTPAGSQADPPTEDPLAVKDGPHAPDDSADDPPADLIPAVSPAASDPPASAPPATPPEADPQPAPAPEPAAIPTRSESEKAHLPFAGQSLEAVAREMTARYGGRDPGPWGEHVPGVVSKLEGVASSDDAPPLLALTLDACAGDYDPEIIALLRRYQIPATLFLTSRWMDKHPDIVRELAANPLFEIAAHGERHRPCSVNGKSVYGIKGTANMLELVREVLGNARRIAADTGKAPRWFRSGTAFYDEAAVRVIQDLGMGVAGYSIAGDEGATLPADRVAAKVPAAKNGDILLLHMNKPKSGTREGLKRALPELLRRGARFVRLSDER
jgi:peptidoglycan/xylan/chitin deacetylase (PgdA/CDA1 family)